VAYDNEISASPVKIDAEATYLSSLAVLSRRAIRQRERLPHVQIAQPTRLTWSNPDTFAADHQGTCGGDQQ